MKKHKQKDSDYMENMANEKTAQKDNLSKFGSSFQTKTLSCLLSDKKFTEQMLDILDTEYYDKRANQWICSQIIEYWNKYRDAPTLDFFKNRLSKVEQPDFQQNIKESLKNAFRNREAKDLDYVKDEFLDFAKNQAMKVAIMESVDMIKRGDYESIRNRVDKALNAGLSKDIGHIYRRDMDLRMQKSSRKTIGTGFDVLDDIMDGGLGAGELGVFVGSSGAGKTWFLASLGAAAMLNGAMVAHYTLELSDTQTGLRYDSILSGYGPSDVRHHKSELKELIEKIRGDISIRQWPARTVSVQSIRAHVQRLETIHRKPDLILVDYADLLKTTSGRDYGGNSYDRLGEIYIELRAMATELGVPIWTVSQANRNGASADIIGADLIADSYQKIMHSDFVASIARTSDDKQTDTARIHVMKNRFGPDGVVFPAIVSCDTGHFELFEQDSDQAEQLIRRMEQQKASEKNRHLSRLVDDFMNGDLGPRESVGI